MVTVRKYGAGQAVRRTEDKRFVTGHGRYSDDINVGRQAHGFVLRSPHAHAKLGKIDTKKALKAPGVVLILTGADLAADKIGSLPCLAPINNKDGSTCALPPYPVLATDKVRFVGDAVAFIVAETVAEARDAAELVEIDYDTLPSVSDCAEAGKPGAPQLFADVKNNMCADWELGDKAKTDAAFAKAHHITKRDLINNRVIVASMEPRGMTGMYEPAEDRFTLYTGSQGVHSVRGVMAGNVFDVPTNRMRVVTNDVGGGFGMKAVPYREQALVLWAAKRLHRPVKWISERSDAMLSDTHGRDHATHAEMAFDKGGKILGLRVHGIANMGAYLSCWGPCIPTEPAGAMHAAVYSIQNLHITFKVMFTNTTPIEAYRGAGRPEAAYVVERMVEAGAHELGMSPADLRRKNFIPPASFPHKTVTGLTYDSGNYEINMDQALKAADWAGFEARRREAAKRGKARGIGMAYYIEICGTGGSEMAEVRIDSSGAVTLMVGTQSNGQGHETAYAQVLSERLGIPFESITLLQGDTNSVIYGSGTGGSRSLQTAGPAINMAADKVIAKAKKIAAHMLEAAEADITFGDGTFTIAGTDKKVSFDDVRARAFQAGRLPVEVEPGLNETAIFKQTSFTFPNGCHISEVEIDPDTGKLDVVAYTIVDDFGRVVNPMLVEGQVHGGLGQGLGQALLEGVSYDSDGQLLTGSFMDYCMPRADNLPSFSFRYNEVPSPANPLGVKGCGEAGCVGGPPSVMNAAVDALRPYGVQHLDMPVTPQRIWRAIHGTKRKAAE
ncbi:MAG: xanthine dehydrogenase family protein molybdopterin-binding subunit [Alphaproteobacteria bacterium]|nr:xanthine dehydrogenase family protein molybdopterin-binding subunit [Alphaproteobacteria bacterium]